MEMTTRFFALIFCCFVIVKVAPCDADEQFDILKRALRSHSQKWDQPACFNRQAIHFQLHSGEWVTKLQHLGIIVLRGNEMRWSFKEFHVIDNHVVPRMQELKNWGTDGYIQFEATPKAKQSTPDIDELSSRFCSQRMFDDIQWNIGKIVAKKNALKHGRPTVLGIKQKLPLQFGITDLEPSDSLFDKVLNAESHQRTVRETSFLGRHCEEWTFTFDIGIVVLRICPALDYSPVFIRINKKSAHPYLGATLYDAGYDRAEYECRYISVNDDMRRFTFQKSVKYYSAGVPKKGWMNIENITLIKREVTDDELKFTSNIPNDTPILIAGSPQISAAWVKDRVNLTYDKHLVSQIDRAQFEQEERRRFQFQFVVPIVFLGMSITLSLAAYSRYRRKILRNGIRQLVIVAVTVLSSTYSSGMSTDKYCGVYSMYGAAKVLNQSPPSFDSLIQEQFISERSGSTIGDLVNLAQHLELRCEVLEGLGIATLRETKSPMILHVASRGQIVEYDHWVLFLGIENGNVKIVDSSICVIEMPIAHLLARWDGVALVVDSKKSVPKNTNTEIRFAIANGLLAIVVVGFVFAVIDKYLLHNKKIAGAATFVFSCTLLLSYSHFLRPESIFRNPEVNKYVTAAVQNGNFPIIDFVKLTDFLNRSSSPVIVDARYERDFLQGAVPGAINIPADSDLARVMRLTDQIDRDSKVIVYCQSSKCTFDERVAIKLVGAGFSDIVLYRNGWVEYEAQENGGPIE